MKKVYIVILAFCMINLFNYTYGVTNDFKFVIDTIGIPRYNVYGYEINEDIYYRYNVFVYGDPNSVNHYKQRFKSVPNLGKWSSNGIQGEHYILGYSYSGDIVCNVYFPVDAIPETTPDNWNFIYTPGAYESWNNRNKYKYIDQLEYMKDTSMLFDELNFSTGHANPYNLISYNISANKIGLNKVTLDTCSTWKTNGVITARRRNNRNQVRYSTFSTAPMAAHASLRSNISTKSNYTLNNTSNIMYIPVDFGCEMYNLNHYAKVSHVKEIKSTIYVDNVEITSISGSKIGKVDKKIYIPITRDKYNIPKDYPINIKVKSYLYTEFSVDGLYENEINKTINLKVDEKVNPVKDIDIYTLEKDKNNLVVRPLVQTNVTKQANSKGIFENKRYSIIKVNLNTDISKEINNLELFLNDKKTDYEVIKKTDKFVLLKLTINTNNSLKSWSYLRDETHIYFDIDMNKIGNRISKPITIKVKNNEYENIILVDVLDDYTKNINYIFDNDVINKDQCLSKKLISDINE
ncbi:MAG: hypothetical protein RSE41_02015 [Clostridia bacterium]